MDNRFETEIRDELKKLNKTLEDYHKQTVANKTDIAWLKRGLTGLWSGVGAWVYIKLTGST